MGELKNTFQDKDQNMAGFFKLLPQKMHFRTQVSFKIPPSKNVFLKLMD